MRTAPAISSASNTRSSRSPTAATSSSPSARPAVSGVLGRSASPPEQLEIELNWIDENIGDHPYCRHRDPEQVNEGMDGGPTSIPRCSRKTLNDLVPQGTHRLRQEDPGRPRRPGGPQATTTHCSCSAGPRPPPPAGRGGAGTLKVAHDRQRAGHPARRHDRYIHEGPRRGTVWLAVPGLPKHADAGVDIITPRAGPAAAAATSARSCCGPQVVKGSRPGSGPQRRRASQMAVDRRGTRAGAARGPGRIPGHRRGVREQPGAACRLHQGQPRHRAAAPTGKPAPLLKNDWTEGIGRSRRTRKPLGMPLQYMVSGMAVAATHKFPNESVDVAFNPDRPGGRAFTKVGEDLRGDRALGAGGVPGGHRDPRRAQRGRRGARLIRTAKRAGQLPPETQFQGGFEEMLRLDCDGRYRDRRCACDRPGCPGRAESIDDSGFIGSAARCATRSAGGRGRPDPAFRSGGVPDRRWRLRIHRGSRQRRRVHRAPPDPPIRDSRRPKPRATRCR